MPRLRGSSLFLAALAGCSGSAATLETAGSEVGNACYVAPSGNDGADGTAAEPFRTLWRALESDAGRVVLLAGSYPEPRVRIGRRVRIEGPEGRAASLEGLVSIEAHDVSLSRLELRGGLRIERARNVTLEDLRVDPGERSETIALEGAQVRAHRMDLGCAAEACLSAATSTLSLSGLVADAGDTKRGILARASVVEIEQAEVSGTSIAQIQAEQGSRLAIRASLLQDAKGNGLVTLGASSTEAEAVHIRSAAKIALLAQASRVAFVRGRLDAAGSLTVGISAGEVEIRSTDIVAAAGGAISLGRFHAALGKLTLAGGTIAHGSAPAILVSSGELVVRGTRFSGLTEASNPGPEGADAILATGVDSRVTIEAAHFDRPARFAVSLHEDASGTITATVTEPAIGGVEIVTVAVEAVAVRGSRIEGCAKGSGIVALDAIGVTIQDTTIARCAEAGVLAGEGSVVTATAARVEGNQRYGFAAFGGAILRIAKSTAEGSPWAAFASCGDGARIEDEGGNRLRGTVARCP